MADPNQEASNPLFAEIQSTGQEETVTRLSLFGKSVVFHVKGNGHLQAATRWADEWNQHLNTNWMEVRLTAARMMEAFMDALAKSGVPVAKLEEAVLAVNAYGQG